MKERKGKDEGGGLLTHGNHCIGWVSRILLYSPFLFRTQILKSSYGILQYAVVCAIYIIRVLLFWKFNLSGSVLGEGTGAAIPAGADFDSDPRRGGMGWMGWWVCGEGRKLFLIWELELSKVYACLYLCINLFRNDMSCG